MMLTRRALLLALGFLLLTGHSVSAQETPLSWKARKILILGDSITHSGHYVHFLETHLRLAGVDPLPEIINIGLSSETCSGLSEPSHPFPRPNVHTRLDQALEKVKPDVVMACYGMNDGIYHPPGEERFQAYQAGIMKLVQKSHAAGAKVILLTPPPFDPVPLQGSGKLKPAGENEFAWSGIYEDYDSVLKGYGQWILERQRAERSPDVDPATYPDYVIDLHGPFKEFLTQKRKNDPKFSVTPDGIHPNAAGHRVIAEAVLKGWGLQPLERIDEELLNLVSKRSTLLHDAWLTHVGHERPGVKAGLPLEEANKQAVALQREINARIADLRQPVTSTVRSTGGSLYTVQYPGSPRPGELVLGATYRLWIPDSAQVLRGVIVHQHGCGVGASTGGATAAEDLHWQALARKWNCALLGPQYETQDTTNCRLWCDPRNGSSGRFLEGLEHFAQVTGHAELRTAPWCLWGHSGGAFWASLMQVDYPERCVAIWLRSGTAFGYWEKGDIARPELSDAVYGVPVMANPGVKERDDQRFHVAWDGGVAMLRSYRSLDAPFGFAGDPRTSHECGDSRYLAIPYFDTLLGMRLPEKLGEPLRAVDQSNAWLANLDGTALAKASEFTGDRQKAVWLPNEDFARKWQEYIATGAVSDTTPPPAPTSVTVTPLSDGRRISWEAEADFESGIRQFVIMKNGQEIGRVPAEPKGRFGRPLAQTMSYHDTPESPMPELAFVDHTSSEGEPRYEVAVINSVGLTSATTVAPPPGFTAIFNGKDLAGWHARPHFDPRKFKEMAPEERDQKVRDWWTDALKHWTVENGELVNDGKGAYLTTDREYGDIEFLIEYKTVPLADSGIYLRGTPQVQIWDYTKEGGKWNRGADKGSGGLFNNTPGTISKEPLVLADKPFGEWNSFRILQVGSRTSVWLNGQLVVDHAEMENFWDRSQPLFSKGVIQLQTHGGEIRWRNLFIREIGTEEANRILAEKNAASFSPIFNGKDFTGWQGPVDQYEVKDGAIVCRPGKGGNIFTSEVFEDFVVRLEFKLPPGGNNGLAIRYPGIGRPSVDAMTELQILDDDHPRYAKLDPRQYNGSAYGMSAAHRGFLRPTGEWNFMEVTVQGSTIRVEQNGTVILKTDLSQVTEFKDNASHPGKDLKRGHFGFAGHNEPVAFRNISVQRLRPVDGETSWHQFKGPNANGVVNQPSLAPLEIGPEKNIVWKVPLLPGHSSPVVLGDRIYLTGVRRNEVGDEAQLVTLACSTTDGSILWEQPAPHRELEIIHAIGSHAQCSCATDGEIVLSFFGSAGLFCYNAETGALNWALPMGPFNNTYGSGASPIIEGDRILLLQDHDTDSFLMALNKANGEVLWRVDRSEFPRSFSTPVIWNVDGRKQVVAAGTLRAVGYDLETGQELWTVRGLSRSVCATPTIGHDNTLYIAAWSRGGDETGRISLPEWDKVMPLRDANGNGTMEIEEMALIGEAHRRYDQVDRDKTNTVTREEYEFYRTLFDQAQNNVVAIQPGGAGDITDSYVLWRHKKMVPFCSSPLACNGYLFTVKDGGIVTSLNARTGEVLQTQRVSGTGSYYASPVSVNGRIYLIDQSGDLTVIGANAEFKELWKASFEEDVYATPAIVGDRIYVRTAGHLYCFGPTSP